MAGAVEIRRQQAGSDGLLITEFSYDPPGLDAEREWVEVANLSGRARPIAGYGLGDEEQHGGAEAMLRFPPGSEIGAGEIIVIAQSALGFRSHIGRNPDFEITDTDAAVPDMTRDSQYATGQLALANDGDEIILLDDHNTVLDSLSYGDSTVFFSPSIPLVVTGQSVERVPAACDTNSAMDWRAQNTPTPGEILLDGACASPASQDGEAGPQMSAIGEIQGSGAISPLLNQIATFRGIVTGTMEDQNASGVIFHTIFVQDPPGSGDSDPTTSDAIAVFLGRQPPLVDIGDQVVIIGQVTEFFGLTEIDDSGLFIESEAPAHTLPDPVTVEMPQDATLASDYLEALEGMLVDTEGPLPVFGPTHSGCGFAVGSTPDAERPLRHSGQESYLPPLLVLSQSDVDCSSLPAVKSGDFVTGVSGPLTYHFEQYKIVQQNNDLLQVESSELAQVPDPTQASGKWFRVATLNLDNYLTPLHDQGGEQLSGHLSSEETLVKQRKLGYAISNTLGCPELLGVQEVETEALLLDLADLMVDSCGFHYQVTHHDSADGRGIDVALLSDPRRTIVEKTVLRQTCSPLATDVLDSAANCLVGEDPLFSRPPLEVKLRVDGEPFTIFVNHFKSKRGGEVETAPRRLAQASHVHDLVKNQLTQDPQAAIIVLGDFNDYNLSPVWQRLQEGGVLYDTMQLVPPRDRYSYIFDGAAQLVDGILVSPVLVQRIQAAQIYHVNADFPAAMAEDDSPHALPYHASDHDPLLVVLKNTLHSNPSMEVSRTSPAPRSTPQTTIQPTVETLAKETAASSIQPAELRVSESKAGWRRYLYAAAVGLALLVTAVLWLARHITK